MDAIEKRKQLAAEMHALADFLADTDDPQIGYLPASHWDLMTTMLRAFCPKPAVEAVLTAEPSITLALVLSEVSLQMRVPAPIILSAGRKNQHATFVRHVAMYLCRRVAGVSYPNIAEFFRKENHTTVMHAEMVIAQRIGSEPGFARTVDKLCAAIRCRADRVADASRKAA